MQPATTKKIILLTGPLGVGKTAVLGVLASLGHATLDADQVGHSLLIRGGQAYQQLLDRFGPQILDLTGEIDRLRLHQASRAVPGGADAVRATLSSLVRQRLDEFLLEASGSLAFIKCHDAETYALGSMADSVWTVSATPEQRIRNLVGQHGWSQEAAWRFVNSSRQQARAFLHSDVTITRGESDGELSRQVQDALRSLGWQRSSLSEADIATPGAADQVSSQGADRPAGQAIPAVQLHDPKSRTAGVLTGLAPIDKTEPDQQTISAARPASLGLRELRLVGGRLLGSVLILVSIAFLTSWGLIMAEYGRQHLPITPLDGAWRALRDTAAYLFAHPSSYFWAKVQTPWVQLVAETLGRSAGLLLLSLSLAVLLGFPFGLVAARMRRGAASALTVLLSIVGASMPSFLLAMILWAANSWVHRAFAITVLPATGFGWDAHVIMPALVLAMRPLAQVAQITYVSVREALGQDYVRTAQSKGLTWRSIETVHLLPNVLIPILNTIGASLRFSLASLPIVEVFFHWPGVGMQLLDAINAGERSLVVDLILSLGLFFLIINMLIEFSFPFIDPRLRAEGTQEQRADAGTVKDWLQQTAEVLSAWIDEVKGWVSRRSRNALAPLPATLQAELAVPEAVEARRHPSLIRNALRNPAFLFGLLMLVGLAALAVFGEKLPGIDPYRAHGVMMVAGKIAAPPFKQSLEFPWGSDHLGRDVRSLVLAGARRTLSLALFGMVARVVMGALLGILAGWQRGSWFDRLVLGATGVWAAFPATLFAMIVIQALGIQQGMWVFVVAISVVGWGEVAQIVRAHVVTLKPQAFIESARSIGARPDQVLLRHVLPNLVNPLSVLAALEMGGILMLLAELGFLNVFVGGGFKAIIGEAGRMVPIVATYSDVPEWSALIANIRDYWRSYPWMALYPGLAIFLAIIAFNLFGEGLRRFLEDNAIGLGRFINRYTVLAGALGVAMLTLVLRASAPLDVYRADALRFDEARAMQDVRVLADPRLQGRETGLPGADLASMYIAQRMAEIGLAPGGEHYDYYQRLVQPRLHLQEVPTMAALDPTGAVALQFEYRKDFVEIARSGQARGTARAPIMGVAFGPQIQGENEAQFGLGNSAAADHIIIVRAADYPKVAMTRVAAALIVADSVADLQRRDVYPYVLARIEERRPALLISPATADLLLRTAGSSLSDLDTMRSSLAPGSIQLTQEGIALDVAVEATDTENMLDERYINVLGVIPGQGYLMGTQDRVIVVGAYYDGVGTDPLGVVYPGANDNASGVAVMLELARLLKSSSFQPDKTVLFAAWAGGERQEGLSISNILNARPGAGEMTVETVIELSGVGYGTGDAVAIGNESSYRLVQLFQQAAARYDAPTTTLGRGPHFDLPVLSTSGGRDATTLALSWDGSDSLAHTPQDTFSIIDPGKLRQIGRSAYLTLLVLSRETEY